MSLKLLHHLVMFAIQPLPTLYHGKMDRYSMIYINHDWWTICTENSDVFSSMCSLVLASWNWVPDSMPDRWSYQTIWQYNDHSKWGRDSDSFNGDLTQLTKLTTGWAKISDVHWSNQTGESTRDHQAFSSFELSSSYNSSKVTGSRITTVTLSIKLI